MDDKEQQRLYKTITAQLTELVDALPDDLAPDLDDALFRQTLRLDEDGNIAFAAGSRGYYRADDGLAWTWEREPGPHGVEVVEYLAGEEVARGMVSKPPELN